MNLHRAHTEILILALAAVLILFVSVATKTPEQRGLPPQVSSQAVMPCLLYTSPSPRDVEESRMPSSA